MAKHARIDDGKVVEVLEADSLPQFHPSLTWVENVADVIDEGWLYDGNSFSDPETLVTVAEVKAARINDVSDLRDSKYFEGFDYQGKNYQIDLEAQKDMTAIQVQFLSNVTNPHGGAWRTSDNESVTMNDAQVQAFIQAAFTYVSIIKNTSWTHKESINALNAKQDIIEYDITIGWGA